MLIEVYSDMACPWCFIGKRRLERAGALRPELKLDLRWRAFQLNPWMPAEGMSRGAYLTAKFGSADPGRIYDKIRRIGQDEGVDFAFDRIARAPNTVDAHRLTRWASREDPAGGGDRVVEALFHAYFVEARDIGALGTLTDIAVETGFERAGAAAYLAGDIDREHIRAEDGAARQMGIQGVPCFIVDRRYAVSGAQEPEYFMPLFDLAENPTTAASSQAAAD